MPEKKNTTLVPWGWETQPDPHKGISKEVKTERERLCYALRQFRKWW